MSQLVVSGPAPRPRRPKGTSAADSAWLSGAVDTTRTLVTARSVPPARDGRLQPEFRARGDEPLSPELALVDPELGARARASLPDRVPDYRPARPLTRPPAAPPRRRRARAVPGLGAADGRALAARARDPHRRRGDPARAGPAPCRAAERGGSDHDLQAGRRPSPCRCRPTSAPRSARASSGAETPPLGGYNLCRAGL